MGGRLTDETRRNLELGLQALADTVVAKMASAGLPGGPIVRAAIVSGLPVVAEKLGIGQVVQAKTEDMVGVVTFVEVPDGK